jgi:hypothetical protein
VSSAGAASSSSAARAAAGAGRNNGASELLVETVSMGAVLSKREKVNNPFARDD